MNYPKPSKSPWADRYHRVRQLERDLELAPYPVDDMDSVELRSYLDWLYEARYPRCVDEGPHL